MNKKLLKRILSLLMALIMFINISCFYSLKPREVKAMGGTVVVTGSAITLATALKYVIGAVAVCGALVGAEALVNNADDIKNGINKLENDIKDTSTDIYQNLKSSCSKTGEKIKNNIGYISAKYGANVTNDLLDDSSWWEIPGDVEIGNDLIINIPWGDNETESDDVVQPWEKNMPDEYFENPQEYTEKFFEQYNQESEINKEKLGGGGNNGNNFKNSKFWKKIKGFLTLGALVGGSMSTIGSMLGHYFSDYEQLESEKSALTEEEYNNRYNSLVDSITNDESLIVVKKDIINFDERTRLFNDNYFVSSNDTKFDGCSISPKNKIFCKVYYKTPTSSSKFLGYYHITANNGYFGYLTENKGQHECQPYIMSSDFNDCSLELFNSDNNDEIYIDKINLKSNKFLNFKYNDKTSSCCQCVDIPCTLVLNDKQQNVLLTFSFGYVTDEYTNKILPQIFNKRTSFSGMERYYLPYLTLYGDIFTKEPDGNLIINGYANTLTKKDNIKSLSKEVDKNISTNFKISDTLRTVTPEQTRDIAVTDKLIETAIRVQQNFPEDTKPTPEQLNQIAFEEVQKTFDNIIDDVQDPITTPDYEDIIDGTFTPDTTDPTLPSNPSTPDVPDVPEDINFNGINGIDLKKFFPFCIPFDLYNFLVWLNKEPETPLIELPIVIDMLHINFILTLDLSDYEALSNILRTFLAVIYTVALMLKTRDIIRG